MNKTALITGINGQDGSYLAEFLDNPQQVYNNNTVGHRIKTYVSQQSR